MAKNTVIKCFALLFISACANNDNVLFVTKTSLSIIDADTKPAAINIAYDRTEGYMGPVYANGAVPPVYASIESDAGLFDPNVKQLYATGNAALIATGNIESVVQRPLLSNRKSDDIMFFGTSTTLGLKIGVDNDSPVPNSFLFGFRRKEYSFIPLGKEQVVDGSGNVVTVDAYPSVLAAIETTGSGQSNAEAMTPSPAVELRQFFATGVAAQQMALALRDVFAARAISATGQAQVGAISKCYFGLSPAQKLMVWKDADDKNLYFENDEERLSSEGTLNRLKALYQDGVNGSDVDLAKIEQADGWYVDSIYASSGEKDETRDVRLLKHRQNVCFLSKSNYL